MAFSDAIKAAIGAFFGNLGKKEELLFPYSWALVRPNSVARARGIRDEFNKEIVLIENSKEKKIYPYSESMVEILRKQGIPVEYEPEENDEEIEFDEVATFGEVKVER